jgi:hypothetical protein
LDDSKRLKMRKKHLKNSMFGAPWSNSRFG